MPALDVAIGFALFYIGLILFTSGLRDLGGISWLAAIDNIWIMFGLGIAVTLAVQSSSLTTVTLVGFAATGILSPPAVVAGIIGANIGTTGTAWIGALINGMEPAARHAAVVHTLLNLTMAAVALPLIYPISRLAAWIARL